MAKTVPWWSLIPTALFVGVAVLAIGPDLVDPTVKEVTINFPGGGKIQVRSERETLDFKALMNELFSNDLSRNGLLAWLRDEKRLYSLETTDLAEALKTKLCDPIPLKPLEEQLAKAADCASKPLVDALRRLSSEHIVPFHFVGLNVRAGTQAESPHRPGKGRVNVCRTGRYVAQRLQIIDPNTDRKIEVQAGGTYECTFGEFPDIQLDPSDATELFGRPPDRLEKVIAVVL